MGWSLTRGAGVGSGERQSSVWVPLGKGPSLRADRPPVSRGVDTNTRAQPGPWEKEGGGETFSYHRNPTPRRGRGAAGRGGDSRAGESCISHDTAAVRASWEQCPARGNRSSTGSSARRTGGGGGGGSGERYVQCWPARQGRGLAAAWTLFRKRPGDWHCHEAAPTGRRCSRGNARVPCPAPAQGRLPCLQLGCPLLFTVSTGSRLWLCPNPLSQLIRL